MADAIDNQHEGWSAAIRYVAGRKNAEEALGFLSHITDILGSPDPPETWSDALVTAFVPFLGSGAGIDITGMASPVLYPAGLHSALNELHPSQLLDPSPETRRQLVITGHPGLSESSADRRTPRQLGDGGSAAVLGLAVRGQPTGHLTIVRHELHRKGPIGPADLALFREVAALVAFSNVVTWLTPTTRTGQ